MRYALAVQSVLITLLSTGALYTTAYADEQSPEEVATQTQVDAPDQAPAASGTDTAATSPATGGDQAATPSIADKNKSAGEAFLSANKAKPGVVTTPDGLQYKIIKEGAGATPSDSDVVSVNYAGRLLDGTEFDSSYKRGEPATFPVNGVIPGWTEALKIMKPGAVYELYIPSELAYGDNGAPPNIGPDETLIFKVELLKVLR
jgi:FKBP-type peptidyl-prolyl cis-trans isomerase